MSFLDKENVYSADTNRNYEGEITGSGDTVRIPDFTKTITVSDYNEDGTIGERLAQAEEVTGISQEMEIDQQKAFNLIVEDIEE